MEEIQEFCKKLLEFLYRKSYPRGASASEVADFLAGESLPIARNREAIEKTIAYLNEKGYIERSMNGALRITATGIDYLM